MSSVKCPECNLTNWAAAENCKRCGYSLQGNGGASDEDRRNGFERGGWAMGVFDNETMTFINQTYQRADAFLRVGGYPGVVSGEEHALLARLRHAGHRVLCPTDVRARTSARTTGRARGGLADLLCALT